MRILNKHRDILRDKQLDRSTKRAFRRMSKDMFIPVRPTLLEIRKNKLEKIKDKILCSKKEIK